MGAPNLSKMVKNVQTAMAKRSPEILTGIGIAGMITTTVLAVTATPKAMRMLEVERDLKKETSDQNEDVSLTPIETVKATWKCYIPAVVTGTVSIACLIGAGSVHAKRTAALATAYKLSETALTEYRDKVVETLGEKKEQVIKEKIDKDHIDKNPVSKSEVIVTKRGSTLCYDLLSDRYFESDIDKIKKAENELNAQILHDMCGYVSLNEFYDELGLNRLPDVGDDIGWNADRRIKIRIGSQIADDGRPCIVVAHENAPFYEYDR
jgi:hypothetical protein